MQQRWRASCSPPPGPSPPPPWWCRPGCCWASVCACYGLRRRSCCGGFGCACSESPFASMTSSPPLRHCCHAVRAVDSWHVAGPSGAPRGHPCSVCVTTSAACGGVGRQAGCLAGFSDVNACGYGIALVVFWVAWRAEVIDPAASIALCSSLCAWQHKGRHAPAGFFLSVAHGGPCRSFRWHRGPGASNPCHPHVTALVAVRCGACASAAPIYCCAAVVGPRLQCRHPWCGLRHPRPYLLCSCLREPV